MATAMDYLVSITERVREIETHSDFEREGVANDMSALLHVLRECDNELDGILASLDERS